MPADDVMKIFDASGKFLGLFIPAACQDLIEKIGEPAEKPRTDPESDDMEKFNELLASWSFAYPYDPEVSCPACGRACRDWRTDPRKSFRLSSANIGGLLVFHCNQCGATIRHKYFKRHMSREYSA